MLVSSEQIEIPESCPPGCGFLDHITRFGQDAMCTRCPIFNCANLENIPELPICEPEHYRADWAKEWDLYFRELIPFPELLL